VGAMSEIQRLRRALSEKQTATLAQPETVYRVCYVEGQGFGYLDPAGWARVPDWARGRAHVLAVCPSEATAQAIAMTLRDGWQGGGTYYNLETGEICWTIDSEVKR